MTRVTLQNEIIETQRALIKSLKHVFRLVTEKAINNPQDVQTTPLLKTDETMVRRLENQLRVLSEQLETQPLDDFGSALAASAKGQYDEAHPFFLQVVENLSSESVENQIEVYTAFANNEYLARRYGASWYYLEHAVRLQPDDKNLQLFLAVGYSMNGNYLKAVKLWNKLIPYYVSEPRIEQSDMAHLYNSRAMVYRIREVFEKSFKDYQEALRINLATLPENHPETAETCFLIAMLFKNQNRQADALPYFNQALAIMREVLPNHPDTLEWAEYQKWCQQAVKDNEED